MNFESVNNKQLNQIEQIAKQLLEVLTKSKLSGEPICRELESLIREAADERRARFDETDDGYKGY